MIVTLLDDAGELFISQGLNFLILFLCLVDMGFCIRYIVHNRMKRRAVLYSFWLAIIVICFICYVLILTGVIVAPTMTSVIVGRMLLAMFLGGYFSALWIDAE